MSTESPKEPVKEMAEPRSPEELAKWREEVLAIYDRIKKDDQSYEIKVGGVDLIIYPNVFSPKYFTDSLWFADEVKKIVGQNKMLEIGPGTGIISLFAALNGAEITAIDINPSAVENTKENFTRQNLKADIRQGDLFSPLQESEKFSYIFWNHPFNNWPEKVDDVLLRAGLDHNYNDLRRYIAEGGRHLTEEGHLLLGTGDFADQQSIAKIAKENGYELKLVAEVELPISDAPDSVSNKYDIYEFVRR